MSASLSLCSQAQEHHQECPGDCQLRDLANPRLAREMPRHTLLTISSPRWWFRVSAALSCPQASPLLLYYERAQTW